MKDRENCKNHKKFYWIILIVTGIFAYLFFDQAFDMKITSLHGIDFIRTRIDGEHFGDFYNYTMDKSLNGEYIRQAGWAGCGAIYNIVLYLCFAIIDLPLYFFQYVLESEAFISLLNHYGRIFMIGMTILCAYIFSAKLLKKAGVDEKSVKMGRYLFLSSPIVMFSVIIFNQYDILSVLIVVVALCFYLDGKYYAFSFIIGVAICLKLFALLIFIPLVLLVEKRIWNIIKYMACGGGLYIISTIVCKCVDSGYDRTQELMMPMFQFYDKVVEAGITGAQGSISFFLLAYLAICAFSYFCKCEKTELPFRCAMICFATYGALFSFVYYHPQWELIILPSMIMLVVMGRYKKILLLFEMVISVCFMLINAQNFLDNSIVSESVLCSFYENINEEVFYFIKNLMQNSTISTIINTIFVFSILGILIVSWRTKDKDISEMENAFRLKPMLYIRCIIVYLYMAPPLLSIVF